MLTKPENTARKDETTYGHPARRGVTGFIHGHSVVLMKMLTKSKRHKTITVKKHFTVVPHNRFRPSKRSSSGVHS
jgi:hypothetical protein